MSMPSQSDAAPEETFPFPGEDLGKPARKMPEKSRGEERKKRWEEKKKQREEKRKYDWDRAKKWSEFAGMVTRLAFLIIGIVILYNQIEDSPTHYSKLYYLPIAAFVILCLKLILGMQTVMINSITRDIDKFNHRAVRIILSIVVYPLAHLFAAIFVLALAIYLTGFFLSEKKDSKFLRQLIEELGIKDIEIGEPKGKEGTPQPPASSQ